MCNPNPLPDHKHPPPPPPRCHLYLDLISVTATFKHQETTKPPPSQISSLPSAAEILTEAKALFNLAFPIALTALILYSRSMLSMLFLGHLGDIELAAGSLAIAFANITGYSVLSGLALGMEPLCAQAFGAQRPKLLSLTLQRAVVFLLVCSVPITFLWLNISSILLYLHQDPSITRLAHTYLAFSIPDLITNSFIHPIRIYLRAQGITHPLTLASLVGTAFHLPINYLLVWRLRLGVAGVAAASASSNLVVLLALVIYVWARGLHVPTWTKPTVKCLTGWGPLVRLAAPSCVSVCLEWWCGRNGPISYDVRDVDEKPVGPNVHQRSQHRAADVRRATNPGAVRARELPADRRMRGGAGTARPSTAANVNLGAFYLVGMPVAIGLGFLLGVGFRGLWIGLLSAQVCCAGLMLYVVGTTNWEYQAMRAQLLTCAGCSETTLPRDGDENDSQPLISVRVTSS
ncbi:UNVERIFIED_CONTAM: protein DETOXIFICATION 51 [Sesamum calycinum]|uniref:Protein DETOXIFICATION n=1 Tax=Sesamum calycinum TaxID=2727403 RepID=A0AAW2NVV5_9LAMI